MYCRALAAVQVHAGHEQACELCNYNRHRPYLIVDCEVVAIEQALAGAQQRRPQRDLARARRRIRRMRALLPARPQQHQPRACIGCNDTSIIVTISVYCSDLLSLLSLMIV